MTLGPGKYDTECKLVRMGLQLEGAEPDAVILLVLNGPRGSGMSVQGNIESRKLLPGILRRVADGIESGEGGL